MDFVVSPLSLSHTFGNVTAFMTEYIKGLFPKNYFKTVNIASTIAYREFSIFNNTNKEFLKKKKPMLVIRPRLDIDDNDDVFLNGTYLTQIITDNFDTTETGNLQPFLEDKDVGFELRYLLNRMRIYFDVTIIMEKQIEQINQVMYLKNRVRQNHPFNLETALENVVPRDIIKMIANEKGIDMNNTKDLLTYLNGHSCYPVTYKLRNASGNDEFFRYYPTIIDTMISNLSMDDGSKKGFADDSYTINFTVSTEFNTSGLYYYFTKNRQIVEGYEMSISGDNDRILPIFTIKNLFNVGIPEGWTMYASPMYKVDNAHGPDVLDFKPILNHSILSAIQFHIEKGIPLKQMINILIMKDNDRLDANKGEYSINYETCELTTILVNRTSTYRMIIFVNTLYINNLIGDILNIHEEK